MPLRQSYARGVPNWADLATTDPDAARTFYTDLFGWTFEGEPTDMGPIYYTARLDGHAIAGLSEQPPDMARAGLPALWNVYLATDDCDATTKAAEAAGGNVMMPPMDVMEYGRMSFVADPTGAAFGIWQAKSHIGSELVNEPGCVTWDEVITPDVEKAAEFYNSVFGITSEPADLGGSGYTLLKVGDAAVGGLVAPPTPEIPAHWQVTFAVDDCDATAEQVTAAGGSVMVPPIDLPTVGRFAIVTDPQGAAFGVLQSEPPPGS